MRNIKFFDDVNNSPYLTSDEKDDIIMRLERIVNNKEGILALDYEDDHIDNSFIWSGTRDGEEFWFNVYCKMSGK